MDFMDVIRDPRYSLPNEGALTSLNEGGMRLVSPDEQTRQTKAYKDRFLEAARLIRRVYSGDRWAGLMFREAMTTSDFPNLFGDVLERSVLANYAEVPYTWSNYCKRGTINDFRLVRRFRMDGGASVLDGPIVASGVTPSLQTGGSGPKGLEQVSEYPEGRRTSDGYTNQLYKFGRRMPFAWETLLNDDLDALKDTPALFGRASRRTEEKRVTQLYMGSGGPNATFFSTANKNVLTSAVNPAVTVDNAHLTITSLKQAMIVMMSQVDTEGEPIDISSVHLVVSPALKIDAMSILSATQVWMNDGGGTVGLYGAGATQTQGSLQRLLADNWAKNIVKLSVNYYQPIVDTTHGATAWYLFADPNNGRPAMEMAFLRGHEQPELFMKTPNQSRVGEGTLGSAGGGGTGMTNPMDGDFDTDAVHYKVRHVMGGTLLDPIMAVASTGAN